MVVLWFVLDLIVPTEDEREQAKMEEIGDRNVLEKQLVGRWNHSDYPAGLEEGRYYHILSADPGYSYRGSANEMKPGGRWSIDLRDSVLWIERDPTHGNLRYQLREIAPDYVRLQKIENDSLTHTVEWFRYR